jgi:circadian clock protein KaiB
VSAASRQAMYKFRLFVAADTLNSTQAASNLNALCKAHLAGRHEIEVVDVFKNPKRAQAEGIRMTPTLLKLAPGPVRRIVGTLADVARVMQILGLDPDAA